MKKGLITLGVVAFFMSCSQPPDPAFCWTCTQEYIYNSTDTSPTIQKRDTTKLCDMTQENIDQHEATNGEQIYNSFTRKPMLCVRDGE